MTITQARYAEPTLIRGSGPHLVQRWVLEADGTRYEAIVVYGIEDPGMDAQGMHQYALVCVNVAGGAGVIKGDAEYRYQRWSVTGGGAWYEFRVGDGSLEIDYVIEKFRVNSVDGLHLTRLLRDALSR